MERINAGMSMMEVVMVMGEGNPGAMSVIMGMIATPKGSLDLFLLDSLDIRGSHLYMLNNDCCGRNTERFDRTLMMLRCGVFTKEEIHANLDRTYAIPFIDDSTKVEGVPPYGEDFGPTHSKWNEWCEAQKESFRRRLAA